MTTETYCKKICKGHFEVKSKLLSAMSEYEAEIRLKTIEEYDNFIAKNKGTIDYATNRPCVKIDGIRIFAKESFMEQMKGDKE